MKVYVTTITVKVLAKDAQDAINKAVTHLPDVAGLAERFPREAVHEHRGTTPPGNDEYSVAVHVHEQPGA